MARTGLATLRERLRGLADSGSADYTVGTTTYWADALLDDVLDRHRVDIWRDDLVAHETYIGGGSIAYYDYYSHYGNLEETTGGTAVFIVQDAIGDKQGTATWSADYQRGRITFTADTEGSAMYLDGHSYDLNAAAADIWRSKSAHYALAYDIRTDNQQLSRSQMVLHCQKMADYYQGLAGSKGGSGVSVIDLDRADSVSE